MSLPHLPFAAHLGLRHAEGVPGLWAPLPPEVRRWWLHLHPTWLVCLSSLLPTSLSMPLAEVVLLAEGAS
ncbi:hypothetical protein QJS10_CPB21g01467 [Acorus calamus]|uniref:Uncharacterized protein n=1 Tax=Acorus calamus TaxID=4465 RepID=A0AAV9C4A0_ACOCL|nr:hypothetical protein QJS10_CPB21g01467 [Acorus calamus]